MCPIQNDNTSVNPYKNYYKLMRELKDKTQLRQQMVTVARQQGIKPAARIFHTTAKTVRKWLRRYDGSLKSLHDESKAPHNPGRTITDADEQKIVKAKKRLPTWGARRLKKDCQLPYSVKTIRKVLKKHGLLRRYRRKKHETKLSLREIKKQWDFGQQIDVDTKYLLDIPEYRIQHLLNPELPKWQYTFRDVTTGLLFVAFADELALSYSALFADRILEHLKSCGVNVNPFTIQSDNGSEFVGSWQAKDDSVFTKIVQNKYAATHRTIPPGKSNWQADVETVHSLIETEFFMLESFKSRTDFLRKANSYQLYFNLARENSGKEFNTPWQLIQNKLQNPDPHIPLLTPVFLDQIHNKLLNSSLDYLSSHTLSSHLNKNPPGGYDVGVLPD